MFRRRTRDYDCLSLVHVRAHAAQKTCTHSKHYFVRLLSQHNGSTNARCADRLQ